MINANNVKYYDLVLSHIISNVDSNGRPSDIEIKDLIKICDGDKDLPRVIGKEFEKRDFALVADTRGDYYIALKRNGSAAVFLKNGGFEAELKRQQELLRPPKTREDKLNEMLYEIHKNGGKYFHIEETSSETDRLRKTLLKVGLLEQNGNVVILTDDAIDLIENGETYSDYVSKFNNLNRQTEINTVLREPPKPEKTGMKTYNLFIKAGKLTYNILNIDIAELSTVVDAYNLGKSSLFVAGKKCFLENLYEIQIFEFYYPGQFNNFIKLAKQKDFYASGMFSGPYLPANVLESWGRNVTRDFIKGDYGFTKARVVETGTKSDSKFTMDIFISHSNSDSEIAESLLSLIRKAFNVESSKIRCTSVPGYKLEVGASTDSQLKQEIFSSKVFIAIITTNSVNSTYVTFELGARWGSELPLLPMICDSAGISLLKAPLTGINALDATVTADIHQFIENLGKHLNKKQESVGSYLKEVEALKELSLGKKEEKVPKKVKARTVKR